MNFSVVLFSRFILFSFSVVCAISTFSKLNAIEAIVCFSNKNKKRWKLSSEIIEGRTETKMGRMRFHSIFFLRFFLCGQFFLSLFFLCFAIEVINDESFVI